MRENHLYKATCLLESSGHGYEVVKTSVIELSESGVRSDLMLMFCSRRKSVFVGEIARVAADINPRDILKPFSRCGYFDAYFTKGMIFKTWTAYKAFLRRVARGASKPERSRL